MRAPVLMGERMCEVDERSSSDYPERAYVVEGIRTAEDKDQEPLAKMDELPLLTGFLRNL
ncbi:hypothetical protein COLO4_28371 [Corchorus olitorius]|uniref:Uncharacterized protein n=1 Tax=Corchorus olitorius TaxID=93759 RepID=A0A1R3HLG4_9ROSI|nr:hypothetical protein COLO4_28371 [Corchorus olitorius]